MKLKKSVKKSVNNKNTEADEAYKRMKDRPYYAFVYAKNIIKGRLPEKVEKVFAKDPESAYLYAKHIIKGKLPDFVHNAMIIGSFADGRAKKMVAEYVKEFCS
jgi:hypothetical protein